MSYEIKQNLTNVNYQSRGTNPTWIVIHNTANGTSAAGTAYNNTAYFKDAMRNASAHYFVDDGDTIWQCVRDTDCAWHVGDAWSRNGCTNYNSIGIEVCERADGSFSEHEKEVLSWLVPYLMDKYGISADHVCRHYDVTGKYCPMGYINESAWTALKDRITNGGDDMSVDELLNTKLATAESGEVPVWQLWSWGYTYAMQAKRKCDELEEKLAKVQAGNIDYEQLAKAVNDEAAERMKQ